MGMTMAEKVLARASGRDRVVPGEMVIAKVDITRINDGVVPRLEHYFDMLGPEARIWDPDRVVLICEHHIPPPTVAHAEVYAACRRFAKKHGLQHFYDIGRGGICHQVFVERGYARPGELVAANDSHSCTYGALNVAARGIGPLDMLYLLLKGELWFRVPESIRVVLTGELPPGVYAKDVVLYIAGEYGTDFALNSSIEFVGPAVESMGLSERLTLANMGIELGAKFAMFEADEKTVNYVRERTDVPFTPVTADDDARYARMVTIDVSDLEPQVALPHDVSNVVPVSSLKEGISIDQVFIGSCTNARLEDLQEAASIIKGHKIHPSVRMIVTPASQEILLEATRLGLVEIFMEAGAIVTNSTCGPCGGGSLGVLADGERCLATTNRNFQGRMGSPGAEVYLSSPATAAASAITGVITDPRQFIS